VYVLEDAIIMQVSGGKVVTLRAGETFYESPTDIHSVGRNASATAPANFLVFFVKNLGASTTHAVP
jgi:quercetin dioxygenase-like cupin family protein